MATIKKLSVVSLGTVFIALGTTDAVQAAQFFGESKPLGDGFARSFVTLDDVSGQPLDLGVTLTQGVLPLPTDDTQPDIKFELSLPPEASATAFKQVEITYRPRNYSGVRTIFDVPRISTDFSLLTPQERDLICPNAPIIDRLPTCEGEERAQVLKTPEPGTLPEGFEIGVVPEGRHGIRYFDPTAPLPVAEINGQPQLTSVYNYAIFDGNRLSFLDIVTSNAFLETEPNFTSPIKLPTVLSKSGYYPTEYSVTYNATSQEYNVTLSGLTYRSATTVPEPSFTLGVFAFSLFGVGSLLKRKQKQTPESSNLK
ncbi:hypothetical protein [Coleofasciculus sp. F4-SAH-05]|uniref:hypothetical protein n=1 Tax=Coleofasciculus sp. F4-SAH-05 TaxID=3069525 RepID=UPI0032F6F6B5